MSRRVNKIPVVSLPFIIEVDTTIAGTTGVGNFGLQVQGTNMKIEWGDGTKQTVTQTAVPSAANAIQHTYPTAGVYQIRVSGGLIRFAQSLVGDRLKLKTLLKIGNIKWASNTRMFDGASNLVVNFDDVFFISNSLSRAFVLVANFSNDLKSLQTKNVTNMSETFRASGFNGDIKNWNVFRCQNFNNMFLQATQFDRELDWVLRTQGVSLVQMFSNSGISTTNYTATFVNFANNAFNNGGLPINVNATGQNGRTFDRSLSGGANFADAGAARDYLVNTLGWTISGDTVIN